MSLKMVIILIGTAYVAPGMLVASFLPPNSLHLEDSIHRSSIVTQDQFEAAIATVQKIYAPLVSRYHNRKLLIKGNWRSNIVNAKATRSFRTWNVRMYGGLARRPEITLDGFTLMICHELGHHLAGYPNYDGRFHGKWAATEGQSDYFATQVCLKKIWSEQALENAQSRKTVDHISKMKCDQIWKMENEQNLCYRITLAGKSLAALFSALALGEKPSTDKKDLSVVSQTIQKHPNAQCRLDTFVAGALCTAYFDEAVIPGYKQKDLLQAENEAAYSSCMRKDRYPESSVRPLCWFKPIEK